MEDERCIDRINKLPDEILVMIQSHLTSKEAAASSILCRRWRYLHWSFTKRLCFEGLRLTGEEERQNLVRWVNDVIALREESQSQTALDEFKVWLRLSKAEEGFIHEWVRYALERKAQTLDLNLRSSDHVPFKAGRFCPFPYGILQCCSSIHFKQLRRISLFNLSVSGEALEFLLRNCPLLESLSVVQSPELVTLRVIGPLPSLKRLKIWWCKNVKSVEIRDVNLVRLEYSGPERGVKFVVENAPQLGELFVQTWIELEFSLMKFGSILGQLEMLDIYMGFIDYGWAQQHRHLYDLNFWNLKELIVTNVKSIYKHDSLLPVTRLIRAAPYLQKFVFKTVVIKDYGKNRGENMERKNLYENLKEVEYVGYGGEECEIELLMHLVINSAALQKITIHHKELSTNLNCEEEMEARAHAHLLLEIIAPPHIILESI